MYHRDNKEWLYVNRNLHKVAECKVKPFELFQRNYENKNDKEKGEDVDKEDDENLKENLNEATHISMGKSIK